MNDYGLHVDIRVYSVFDIYNMIKLQRLDISPDYIRKYRWPEESKRQLIRSMMQGFPISSIYVQEYMPGFYRLIDGVQRLNTIVDFLENRFPVSDVNRNPYYFSDLSLIEQRKFQDYQLPIYIIKGKDENISMFSAMVNASTMSVVPQESRNYKFYNQGIPFIRYLAKKESFKVLILGKDVAVSQMQDEELVLRFLSFYYKGFECYDGKMMRFLDDTLERYGLYEHKERKTEQIFESVCRAVYNVWEENAFVVRSGQRKRVNTALFDVIMYSFSKADLKKITDRKEIIRDRLECLLEDDMEFRSSIIGNANTSKKSVYTRFKIWLNEMQKII